MTVRSSLRPVAIRTGQRVLVHGVGRATSQLRVVPNLLIAGGQRCGTTSMYRALSQHPAIRKPLLHKGVHYFDTNYQRGPWWYRSHFPTAPSMAALRKRQGVDPVVFESSPYYGFHPLAAERIATDLPDVKLLVLVRDPVERAYSAHAHEIGRGYETEPFEQALELEPGRLAGEEQRIRSNPAHVSHAHQHQAYVARGHYVDLLRHLEDAVGRERLHVVDSHLFFTEPEFVFYDVLEFLGLPPSSDIRFEQHNARPRSAMDETLRRRLDAHFQPYDEELATWLGWVPSWRR